MADGVHHLHRRKRIHQQGQPYPHPDKLISSLDSLVFAVALFGVVMTVPQVTEIWLSHDASGVSLLSWGAYALGAGFWMAYGIVHKERVILAIYALYALLDVLVILGVLAYS